MASLEKLDVFRSTANWIDKNKIELQIASGAVLTTAAVAAIVFTSIFTAGLATFFYATLLGTVGFMSLTAFIAGIVERREANEDEKEFLERYIYLQRLDNYTHQIFSPINNDACLIYSTMMH